MTHWQKTFAAIGGTAASLSLEKLNVVLGFFCTLITFLLLVRSAFKTFRGDLFAWRKPRPLPVPMPALVEKTLLPPKEPPAI